jgi:hypothetical protein
MCYTGLRDATVEREGGAINHGPLAEISIAIMKRTRIYIIMRTHPHYTRSAEPKQQDMLKIAANTFPHNGYSVLRSRSRNNQTQLK